ncbi:mannosylglycerate hydrolase [Enterococcus sp. AZ196]|uniref:mannosylglycerate hydrolase n=1 Tax=Enterococcus sp. AZ196 TaxID=2774659 RepID=UPI003D2BA453
MKNVHIVPHMHWDREWYFTTEESRILLVNNMSEILDMLENNPDYPYYVLDGQTALLEDYFAVCPEKEERVKRLIQEGRLIVGPWYSQTDELVVGGESIVRNLLYGLKDSKKLGNPMMIGYLPDSFGQSAQMPQILNGFDIERVIFWRGVSERHGTDRTEFYWEGSAGSKVLTQLFPLGYAIGKYLPTEKEPLKERMDKYFGVLDRGATTDEEIIPNGHDQMPIQKNIFQVIESLEELYPERKFFLSRYENVFDILEKKLDLPRIKGEFIDGKYSRVHRSIFSTRMDIKAANARIENKLTNILEPLASIAYSLGHEYHHGLIEGIWKEIMKNHAHDSIGCCCSDKAHFEIMARFVNAEERTDRLIEFYQRKLSEGTPDKEGTEKLVVFNLVPYERKETLTTTIITKKASFHLLDSDGKSVDFDILNEEIIDPGLIDRQIVHYGNYEPFVKFTISFEKELPAMGYETLYIEQSAESASMKKAVSSACIENDRFKLWGNPNGTITLLDKASNEEFSEMLYLEDVADDGDEYDFSPLENDRPILSKDEVKATVEHSQNSYAGTVNIAYEWCLPKHLEERKQGKNTGKVSVNLEIELPKASDSIRLTLRVDNQCKDHRTRIIFPTGIESQFSFADNQFGTIRRGVHDQAMEVWEKEDWDERPDMIFPFLTNVSLSNKQRTAAILTNSSREYEIIGEKNDCIAITLFRSIGVLGKENLVRRPGRPSGIKLPTPDSQMLREIQLEFGLVISNGPIAQANPAKHAKEYLTPFVAYNQMGYNAMKLNKAEVVSPNRYSLFTQKNEHLILSTVKKAENSEKILGRFFNPLEGNEVLQLEGAKSSSFYDLKEEPIHSDKNELSANEVITIDLEQ